MCIWQRVGATALELMKKKAVSADHINNLRKTCTKNDKIINKVDQLSGILSLSDKLPMREYLA